MNLNFLISKKHIFKQRQKATFKVLDKNYFYHGLFSSNKIRFEFVHLKVIKKIFRKKYYKRDKYLNNVKYWVMIRPNFLLTMKSKNSRMGSGVGAYVRVCFILTVNQPIIFFKNYSHTFIRNVIQYFKLKMNQTLHTNLITLL